jgi:hypothetical protein
MSWIDPGRSATATHKNPTPPESPRTWTGCRWRLDADVADANTAAREKSASWVKQIEESANLFHQVKRI